MGETKHLHQFMSHLHHHLNQLIWCLQFIWFIHLLNQQCYLKCHPVWLHDVQTVWEQWFGNVDEIFLISQDFHRTGIVLFCISMHCSTVSESMLIKDHTDHSYLGHWSVAGCNCVLHIHTIVRKKFNGKIFL